MKAQPLMMKSKFIPMTQKQVDVAQVLMNEQSKNARFISEMVMNQAQNYLQFSNCQEINKKSA